MAPDRACKVIVACSVLFRLSKEYGEPYLGRDHILPPDVDVEFEGQLQEAGIAARARLVATFFQ